MARLIALILLCTAPAFAQAPPPVDSSGQESSAPAKNELANASANADKAYESKLNDLQGRVNELKEKIFRTKTRLAILKESILSTSIAGAGTAHPPE